MISNEQRAHDIAVAGMQYLLSNPQASSIGTTKDEHGNIKIDIFKVYQYLYQTSLDAVNREFPEKL